MHHKTDRRLFDDSSDEQMNFGESVLVKNNNDFIEKIKDMNTHLE